MTTTHKRTWYLHQRPGRWASKDDKPWRSHTIGRCVGTH